MVGGGAAWRRRRYIVLEWDGRGIIWQYKEDLVSGPTGAGRMLP